MKKLLFKLICFLSGVLLGLQTSSACVSVSATRRIIPPKNLRATKLHKLSLKEQFQPRVMLKQKLSVLKLVQKTTKSNEIKQSSRHYVSTKRGATTLIMLIWGGILATVMAFVSSHAGLGIIFAVLTFIFLGLSLLSGFKEQNAEDTLWLIAQILNLVLLIASFFD